jgi:tyrosyl-tRNA synthetase
MQIPDHDVRRFLLQMTLLEVDEALAVAAAGAEAPERREAQRRLAREVTTLVHGPAAAAEAEAASAVLFGAGLDDLPPGVLDALVGEVDTTAVPRERLVTGVPVVELLVETGLEPSRSAARRSLQAGAIYVNNRRWPDPEGSLGVDDLWEGRHVLLRRGKRDYHLVTTGGGGS